MESGGRGWHGQQLALYLPGVGASVADWRKTSKLLANLWCGTYTECTLGFISTD